MISVETTRTHGIFLRPFQPDDQTEVKQLILSGLEEHWGVLDQSKNPDLNDIATSYARAIFLVAHKDGRIVGTGALVPRASGVAEIVRMSVAASTRRKGIGTMILQELCRRAKEASFHRIILETNSMWHEVIRFYRGYGFQITHYKGRAVYLAIDLASEM